MKMFAQKKMIVLWFAALALLLAVSACTDYAEEFKDEYEELFALGSSDDSNNESSSSEKGMSSSSIGSGKYETFVDERDSNVYKIVSIGKQKWFAENLRFDSDTSSKVGTNFCAEGDADCSIYGRFYGSKKVNEGAEYCPDGWHTPSLDEWVVLKATKRDIEDYLSVEDGGNNSTGFNALLAGHWSSKASYNRDSVAEFIYRTEISDSSYVVWLSDSEYFSTKQSNASWYAPIRCLSDEYSGVRASSYSVSECDGTTLYDASKDASEQGLEWVVWSCGDSCDSTYSDVGMAAFIGSPDENSDVSNWGGVCVEFESNGTALLWVKKTGDESTFVGLNTPLVATNGVEKRAFPWASFDGLDQKEPYKEGVVEVSYKNFDEPKHVKYVIKKITTLNKNVNLPSRSSDSAPVESSSSVENGDAASGWIWRGDADDGSVIWNVKGDEFYARFSVPMDSVSGTISERMKSLIDTCKGVCGNKIKSNSTTIDVYATIDLSKTNDQWKGLCAEVEGDSVSITVNGTKSSNYLTAKGEFATSFNALVSDSLLKSQGSTLIVHFLKRGSGYFNIRALGNYGACEKLELKDNSIPRDSIAFPLGRAAWKYLNLDVDYDILTDDRDGKRYKTVALNGLVWMAENLNYSTGTDQRCGGSDGLAGNGCNIYGALYKKEDLDDACPTGWHVATSDDWDNLVGYYGGENNASSKLMSQYETFGNNSSKNFGTNESGFSVINAGYYKSLNSTIASFGAYGDFWRHDETNDSFGYEGFGSAKVYTKANADEGNEYPVRCVSDKLDSKSPLSFMNASVKYGTMTDSRDNHIYRTVNIGTQKWFAENLAYDTTETTKCRDDDCNLYGRMYQTYGVNDGAEYCPEGWHTPTNDEWKYLKNSLTDQGNSLISSVNGGGNETGFSAVLIGRFTNSTVVGSGNYADFISVEGYVQLSSSGVNVRSENDDDKASRYRSIRCLWNGSTMESSSSSGNNQEPGESSSSSSAFECSEDNDSWCLLNSELNYSSYVDDRDSRTYKTITYNGLEWFAENLAYNPGGDTITYCGHDADGCDIYGRLYNKQSVMDGSQFCPDDWRIPSAEEVLSLQDFCESSDDGNSCSDLISAYNGGSNSSGLSFVFAGRYSISFSTYGEYYGIDSYAEIMVNDGTAYQTSKNKLSPTTFAGNNSNRHHSIRCVRGSLITSSSSVDVESSSSVAED